MDNKLIKTTKRSRHKKTIPLTLSDKYELLASLMDHIPDVIYFKDKKGRLVMVNEAYARGTGLKMQEIIGKTDFDFFPKKRAEKMAKDDLRVLRTGKPLIDRVERATRIDGVDNYVSTTKMPRRNAKGEIVGLVGITRDITRRTQIRSLREEKARIEKKLEALKEINKIKSEFVSVVSHELRTPLAIIKEAVGLVFDEIVGPVTSKQKEILIKAKDNVGRLSHIIDELLDMSRIERGSFKLHYSLLNFNDLLKSSSEFFQRLAQSKEITLEYSLPRQDINLFIDAHRVNQVVTNLINNAIKFTEIGGNIKVEIKLLENKVRVGVIDTGIGIAKKNLNHLFDKFIQVSKGAEASRKGVGLGLSIAKELVDKHGGEIWVESKIGVGSKFFFTLPRFRSAEVLERSIRDRVNELLDRDVSIYLINLLMVNFKEFKKRLKISPKKLFSDLDNIIETILKRFAHSRHKEKPEIALCDHRNGEYSILLPEIKEDQALKISKLIRDGIKQYFIKNKSENVFIDLGILSYPSKIEPHRTEHLPANVSIKRIYIGSEIRRFRRVAYQANIEILFSPNQAEAAQTVDISQGGVCFLSERVLKTDAQVEIKLKLPNTKTTVLAKARVAWITVLGRSSYKNIGKYKVGLEFTQLKVKDKTTLIKFIKSTSK